MPDRRYSDEEFALILKRASDLQDRADRAPATLPAQAGGASPTDGYSLETVREIAQEVGLEQRFIDLAASSLAHDPVVTEPSLLGGPLTHRLGYTFARTLTDVERIELLDVIRGVQKHQGEVNEVMGSLEWKTVGRMDQMAVTISSNDENVSISVFNDLSGIAALTWIGSITVGLIAGGIVINALQPASVLVTTSILGAGGAVGLGAARAIWGATTRAFHRRTERLRAEITRFLSR